MSATSDQGPRALLTNPSSGASNNATAHGTREGTPIIDCSLMSIPVRLPGLVAQVHIGNKHEQLADCCSNSMTAIDHMREIAILVSYQSFNLAVPNLFSNLSVPSRKV
jgi:hypothetical protein